MEIRFAEPKDVPGILELLRQVGAVHHRGRPDIFRSNAQKYSASQVLSILSSPSSPIFVAVEEDTVLGYCFCMVKTYAQDSVIADHTTLYIDDLCVDQSHRGASIGSALYKTAEKYAKMRGCYSITLNVWTCNPSAVRFYERMGLKPQKMGMETIL